MIRFLLDCVALIAVFAFLRFAALPLLGLIVGIPVRLAARRQQRKKLIP